MPAEKTLIEEFASLYDAIPADSKIVFDSAIEKLSAHMQKVIEQTAALEKLSTIPLYSKRPNKAETAIQFFNRHYRNNSALSAVYADDLRRHDGRLYAALAAHMHQTDRGEGLRSLLPVRARAETAGQRYGSEGRLAVTLKVS